ncbi:MAG TPA: T9SS type A sorting domain-containing protein [Catalimonadaceae bacterium]|nr:T9SS type A sorting domain-containing protein [Catalimonadaceae bacterium]
MRYPVLILFLFFGFLADSVQGANWHPFPFKISYYGVKTSLGSVDGSFSPPYVSANLPLTKGYVVDALYLDSSYSTGNQTIRKRSSKYPCLQEVNFSGFFEHFLGQATVTTSPDSQQVDLSLASLYLGGSESYYPGKIKLGEFAIGTSGVVTAISVQLVLGQPDSVATISMGENTLLWSKTFGVIQSYTAYWDFSYTRIELVGVKDLGLGYQDIALKVQKPKAGDEFHFWNLSKGLITVGNSPVNPVRFDNTLNKVRMKILSADSTKASVRIIQSEPNETTGIEYTDTLEYFQSKLKASMDILQDSLYPVGSTPFNFLGGAEYYQVSFLGWLDSTGIQFKVIKSLMMESKPTIKFISCSKLPWATYNYDRYGGPDWYGNFTEFQYPVYAKIQGRCTFGTPFDSVTITETKPMIASSRSFTLSPNPVENQFKITGISDGEYVISDSFGKIRNRGIVSDQPIEVQGLPSGIYSVQVKKDGKLLRSQKLMKE